MRFQIAVLSIAAGLSADAYAPSSMVSRTSTAFVTSRIPRTTNSQLFSQWEDEDEVVSASPSFEEAGKKIGEEDDQAAMDEMGEFDASGTYNANDVDKYREAIRKRTEALGMEKKTPEEIAAQQAAALEAQGRQGDKLAGVAEQAQESAAEMMDGQMLDLSQITSDAPRGPDENLPAMMYDPSKDMTQEEMEEADPTGLLPWNEQIAWVFSKSKFPSVGSALIETLILVVTVLVTAGVITTWDEWMRSIAFNFNMVPRPEDVASSMEGMIMPGDSILGMGEAKSGADLLQMLQDGAKETVKAAQDGTLKDILQGDVPQDL